MPTPLSTPAPGRHNHQKRHKWPDDSSSMLVVQSYSSLSLEGVEMPQSCFTVAAAALSRRTSVSQQQQEQQQEQQHYRRVVITNANFIL
ncbi:hypothetical protein TYRP_010911 [Tyrophagus putrescentiae]|nr:hypothetical protein TYRP_010911 [Tyrophagus putrescentiae]